MHKYVKPEYAVECGSARDEKDTFLHEKSMKENGNKQQTELSTRLSFAWFTLVFNRYVTQLAARVVRALATISALHALLKGLRAPY